MMQERIERARQLLSEIHHAAIATVNEDGSPLSSPVFMAFGTDLITYWASHPETQHSQNIARDGRVFIVLFDSREGHGGLYIEAKAEPLESKSGATQAYQLLKELKERMYGSMGEIETYLGEGTQRLYQAIPTKVWVNQSERDGQGVIIRDRRLEIPLSSLTDKRVQ